MTRLLLTLLLPLLLRLLLRLLLTLLLSARALPRTGFTETALGPLHAACVGGAPPPPVAVTFPPDFARYDGGEQAH